MTKQLNRFLTGPLMPGSILILALLISLVSYAFMHPEQDGRIFFYPNNSGIEIGSERRSIPHRHDTADRIAVFLDELILGPQTLELTYALPRNTVLRHVAVIGKTAYIDLDKTVLDIDELLPISFDQAMENLRYNIIFNFSGIEELTFTIEGQALHSQPYNGLKDPE